MKNLTRFCLLIFFCSNYLAAAPSSSPMPKWFDAIKAGNLKLFTKLVKGRDINERMADGKTALHVAIETKQMAIYNHIMSQKKLDINPRTKIGETPLIFATRIGNTLVVDQLLKKGGDLTLKDKFCHTAIDFAAAYGHQALHDRLVKKLKSTSEDQKECANRSLDSRFTFAERRLAFHRSMFSNIEKPFDYSGVFASIDLLKSNPEPLTDLVQDITTFIQHRSLKGENYQPQFDLEIRILVVRELAEMKNQRFKTAFANEMYDILSSKSCQQEYENLCAESCGPSSLRQITIQMLDEPQSFYENCPKCGNCAITGKGHAFRAALLWFKLDQPSRNRFKGKLRQLLKRDLARPKDVGL